MRRRKDRKRGEGEKSWKRSGMEWEGWKGKGRGKGKDGMKRKGRKGRAFDPHFQTPSAALVPTGTE